jgi:hypothetical protein
MKKLFLVLCLILSGLLLKSQIAKGTKMIGTSISYSQNKYDTQNTFTTTSSNANSINEQKQFIGTIGAGYFIANNLVVGILAGYSYQLADYTSQSQNPGYNSENTNSSISSIYSIGAYGRIYKMMLENRVGFFANINALYSFGNSDRRVYNVNNGSITNEQYGTGDITGYSISLSPGVVYFITSNIGLEASFGSLSFRSQTENITYSEGNIENSSNTSNLLGFNFSAVTFNVGINFYLSGKKK